MNLDFGVLRRNHVLRILLMVGILFGITYGGVALLKVALYSESPLMVVSSGSMIPTLNIGDIIIVRGTDPATITAGTIIVFHSPRSYDMPIVHRVIGVLSRGGTIYFETKGDNNPVADNWSPQPGVPADYLIGILIARIPYVGLVSLNLRGPTGAIIILALVFAIIVLEYNDAQKQKRQAHETTKAKLSA